jgi:hypothetical protein
MTDYRALCFELSEALCGYTLSQYDCLLVAKARAELAKPAPAPTDDELWAVGNDDFRANCYPTDAIRFARAVLARWGNA